MRARLSLLLQQRRDIGLVVETVLTQFGKVDIWFGSEATRMRTGKQRRKVFVLNR